MPKYVLIDIEGTISDIKFVKEVLFPYAKERIRDFVVENQSEPDVSAELLQLRRTLESEGHKAISDEDCIEALTRWIDEDRKHPVLKTLQGMIWKTGFETGVFKSHIYPDLVPALKGLKSKGVDCGIYSSGSKAAQQLFFKFTQEGDLRSYFRHFFDLEMGSKKEKESYSRIAEDLGLKGSDILFVSDVPAELQAASEAGFEVLHMIRPGTENSTWESCSDMMELANRI